LYRQDQVFVSALDITERSRVEQALRQARAELAHVSRVTTLGELTATIAHEVNQPLAAIVADGQACLRFLGRPIPDLAEAQVCVEQMIVQGRRASDVVQHLRALSKNETLQRNRANINDIIEEAVSLVQRELADYNVTLRMKLQPGLNPVHVDCVQLQQVLINLIINAMHSMESVPIRDLWVETGSYEEGTVQVSVRDCGVGLDDAVLGRLFTPFFTTKPQGIGMGLSICRSIAEAHGGRLWAERNDGPGASFHLSFPASLETIP
jgi:two-component system, LuxR family, sensor kinase FixL